MKGLLGAFFAQVVIITYRSMSSNGIKTGKGGTAPIPAPLPSRYVAAAVVYGGLALAPSSMAPVTTLVGWGLVVANLLGAPLTSGTKAKTPTPAIAPKTATASTK